MDLLRIDPMQDSRQYVHELIDQLDAGNNSPQWGNCSKS